MSLGNTLGKKNDDLFMRIDRQKVPEHVAIIMDGNGRWATKQGLPRSYGHNRGVSVLKEILKVSKRLCKKELQSRVLNQVIFSYESFVQRLMRHFL